MHASCSPSRRPCLVLIPFLIALVLLAGQTIPATAQTPAAAANAGRVQLVVEPGLATTAGDLAEAYGSAITEAWPQFAALFGTEPFAPQIITFTDAVDPAAMTGMRWITDFAWVSPDGTVAVVALDPFLAMTPIEAGNLLRNIVSRGFIQSAAGNAMPLGLLDGIARYVETPVLARQARLGSLVQGLEQSGTLPPWDQIMTATAPDLGAEVQTANAYALVAFITDRYGVAGLRDLVTGFATNPPWAENVRATFGQADTDLATAWSRFLPRWFATGWRENAVSAFDLTRAQTLFDRGAYEASAAEAERSQRLFLDLGDEAGLSRVEALLAQDAVGLQADAIMADVQAILEGNDYAGALTQIDSATTLYALLPDAHRPTGIIDRYTDLARQGVQADTLLAQANADSGSWLDMASARSDAVAAGDLYASLGNADGVTAASGVVERIDQRVLRMLYALSALVVVLAGWLATWLWLRAPSRLQWRRPVSTTRPSRANVGG